VRVLIVEPFPGQRWRSITRYADGLALSLRSADLEAVRACAPWFPPSPLRPGTWAWARDQAVAEAREGRFDIVHLADVPLAHHVRRFRPGGAVAVTVHDVLATSMPGYFHGVTGFAQQQFLRRPLAGLRGANLVVAPSNFNAAGADPEGEIGEHRPVETHLIPLMLDAVLGLRPPLRVLGTDYSTPDGTAIRDYVHVADLAVAHVRALERLLAGGESIVCNLGTGEGHSVRQVIEAAERVTGRPVPRVEAPRRPGDPPALVADARRGMRELGLLPANPMGLERILETAWAWHAEHRGRRLADG
jgi:hypothetical protein